MIMKWNYKLLITQMKNNNEKEHSIYLILCSFFKYINKQVVQMNFFQGFFYKIKYVIMKKDMIANKKCHKLIKCYTIKMYVIIFKNNLIVQKIKIFAWFNEKEDKNEK